MNQAVIEIDQLVRRFGSTEAVNGLDLRVRPGSCYGLFGRNGAGKTTTIKCLLNLLRPDSGRVEIFGLDPNRDEVEVKSRLAYVPDHVAAYPWMRISQFFDYMASFRRKWNQALEGDLLKQFELDPGKKVGSLSRGEKVQMALIGALCPEPELLILDEPTSGLDPMIRREFIRTIIGAYQEADPERRTVFVSTHMITEFEGLIDEFAIMDEGRTLLTLPSEEARREFKRVYARFSTDAPNLDKNGYLEVKRTGRELEVVLRGDEQPLLHQVRQAAPEEVRTESLTLEEIFLAVLKGKGA